MSAKGFLPHVHILPEDKAYRDILIGFQQNLSLDLRRIHVEPIAGGWKKVLEKFEKNHIQSMINFPKRYIVLIIDCDETENRIEKMRQEIPDELKGRVFIIGVWDEAEALKRDLELNYEQIGAALAEECQSGERKIWASPLLKRNGDELQRMTKVVRPILFPHE